MLARLRVNLPDRTGSLARIATAVGNAHADIESVTVLQQHEGGRAFDELTVDVVDAAHLAATVAAIDALRGFRVEGVACPAPPVSAHGDLGLVAQLVAQPQRLVTTLADGLPTAYGAHWALVLRFDNPDAEPEIVAASVGAPPAPQLPLRSLPLRLSCWSDDVSATAVAPLGEVPMAVMLSRDGGPPFHGSEMWRLETLGSITGRLISQLQLV
jgi:ACT domain